VEEEEEEEAEGPLRESREVDEQTEKREASGIPKDSPAIIEEEEEELDSITVAAGVTILEISTRPYLAWLSEKLAHPIVRLRDIPLSEFDDFQSKGFVWIWMMGIWDVGPFGIEHDRSDATVRRRYDQELPGWTRDDVIGWPLAIRAYEVNSELGTDDDLEWLREQFHSRGMKLMLDFVPNHTAVDANEYTARPDLYLHGDPSDRDRFLPSGVAFAAGRYLGPMHFAAQLDLFNRDARQFQKDNLASIARRCDGVRVHLAYYWLTNLFADMWQTEISAKADIPEVEFWAEAIPAAKLANPDFLILGETYGEDVQLALLELGFDYVYDKDIYDCLADRDLREFRRIIGSRGLAKYLHFSENHDEKRAITAFGNSIQSANAATAALLTLPGLRLVNHPQWEGVRGRLDVHLKRWIRADAESEALRFYDSLFTILRLDVVRFGEWTLLDVPDADAILTWAWETRHQRILIAINFSDRQAGGWVNYMINREGELHLRNLIASNATIAPVRDSPSSGLRLALKPWEVQAWLWEG
jgi:hypothetical protein